MALGGGTFLVQNKVLPGAYINFISVAQASATLSDRGIVTIPLAMNWGPEGKIFTVEQADFIKNSQKIFGYAYTADELKPMREIFLHAKTVHFFRLGTSGVKAANTYATAKYPGTRGNDLRTVITANENTTEQKPLFDVATFLGTVQVDLQEGVAAITDLKANAYVDWKTDAQPDPAEALERLVSHAHGGELLLLHSVSSTNAAILGDLIDQLRAAGYTL